MKAFVERHPELIGKIAIPDIDQPFEITRAEVERVASKYLLAVAGGGQNLPPHRQGQGRGEFHHGSFDGRNRQPADAAGTAGHPGGAGRRENSRSKPSRRNSPAVSTRAWITSGDVKQFEKEFNEDLAVIAFAIKKYGLPASLKLSVHSGSDKFSIYEPMRRALEKFDAGRAHQNRRHNLAGGSHRPGGSGRRRLEMAKEIYAGAIEHVDEFCAPYASGH